ncbi:SatD family protein [uncultured Maribacter sp.]|uniref:SatD family protein n=1 Tax=uncultured Maribacter sp. TaxID=431308 RepID=UPI002628C425|nr:SatD family protein [uncultured Maribacter sp.]
MIAIITGDIINSGDYNSEEWIPVLKSHLSTIGNTPVDWEVYRGDEFQVKLPVENALKEAIHLKALLKCVKNLDVRMGIGFGDETYVGNGVTESNGLAYQRSGRTLNLLKQAKTNIAVATGNTGIDETLNLMLKLALDFMDDWSVVSAEIVSIVLNNKTTSQKEIAKQLDIRQSAVSQRLKRARLDLVLNLLNYYTKISKEIKYDTLD